MLGIKDVASALSGLSLREAILFDVTCALSTHVIYNRYDTDAVTLPATFVLLGLIPIVPVFLLAPHFTATYEAALVSFVVFYAVLLTSVALYRLSPVHPLSGYPGPILARISKFWGVWIAASGKNHVYHKKLHEKYGPYLRIGPNELSVTDVNAIPSILGGSGMPKGPMYDGRRDANHTPSLIGMRSFHDHARKRRAWNRAFSTANVKAYEPILVNRVLQLAEELRKRASTEGSDNAKSVNLAEWLGFFAFDFMGDMAFGGGFEMMRDGGDKDGYWSSLEEGTEILAMLQHLPWLSGFIFKLPWITQNVANLRDFCWSAVRRRKEKGSTVKDLFYHLIDEDGVEKEPPSDKEVIANGTLAIIAGSDTTSTVLSELFYFLLTHPIHYDRLQKEVDTVFPAKEGDPFNAAQLAAMPFLNAVINESLRLGPPVGTTLQRAPAKGSGGHQIGSRFIPEGTAVIVPPYTLFRDPRYFSPYTDEFVPERWLDAEEKDAPISETAKSPTFVTNMAAFHPFSNGPANCAGRNLALVEMRMVVALLMQRFEMRFADDYDPSEWEKKLEDWFLLKTGPLHVVLTPRT